MTLRAWVARTSHGTGIAVEAELKTHVVYLVCDGLDALRPFRGISNQMTCTVASFARPAIVDVEVLVTGILESE
jgi:hypothetical protein